MGRNKYTKLDWVAKYKELPPSEIATKTKFPMQQIYYYLRQLGVKKTKVDFLPSAEELRAEGLSQVALAAKYGVSKVTIAKRLKWKQ